MAVRSHLPLLPYFPPNQEPKIGLPKSILSFSVSSIHDPKSLQFWEEGSSKSGPFPSGFTATI